MQNRDWNRDWERERRGRETENDTDWDWYYYEYRYLPYGSERGTYSDRDFDRGRYGDRGTSRGTYGREGEYDYGTYPYGTYSNQGPYTGRGPRGYRRSDERIQEDVNDRLTWHGQIDATDIEVKVDDGVVTLTGSVNSRHEKRMAENMAESVSGVWDVNNNLRVNQQRDWSRGGTGMGMSGQIRQGMEVVGRDGENVGEVKEVRSNDFLVDRSLARDVYIPFDACQTTGGKIRLNVRADEVDNQGWEMPELLETETSQETRKRR